MSNNFTERSKEFSGNQNDQYNNAGIDYSNPAEFRKVCEARRSVRKFTAEKIPDAVVDDVLDLALLAPNSSNLQTWEFYRLVNPKIKADVVTACFSQPAASTAAELIVCVSRPDNWRKHSKLMLEEFNKQPMPAPKSVIQYYSKLVPFVYTVGYFNILTPFKWIFNNVVGLFKVIPREPISSFGISRWAAKSCALACENIMLAFRAHGYDTCPMEGYDSKRVKKAMGLPCKAEIVMIIGAGKRDVGGVYGPRIRFERSRTIKTL